MKPKTPNKLETLCPGFIKFWRGAVGTKVNGGKLGGSPRTITDAWISDAGEIMLALEGGSEVRAMDVFTYHGD